MATDVKSNEITFPVTGMTCASCVRRVEKALTKVPGVAEAYGIACSPHSPAGPVATAAGAQLCATLPNFTLLEYAWGEVPWRSDLVGGEPIVAGRYALSDKPGLGIEVDEAELARRAR